MCDYRRVLDWRLDLLNTLTRLVTTLNYSAIANLHDLQITTAHAKSFQSVSIHQNPACIFSHAYYMPCPPRAS
jgi:hypothetical protein